MHIHNEQSMNHISLKNRPNKCYIKSPTVQDAIRPIPGLVSCVYMTNNCYSANQPLVVDTCISTKRVALELILLLFRQSISVVTVQSTLYIYMGLQSSSISPTCTPILQFAYCVPSTQRQVDYLFNCG